MVSTVLWWGLATWFVLLTVLTAASIIWRTVDEWRDARDDEDVLQDDLSAGTVPTDPPTQGP